MPVNSGLVNAPSNTSAADGTNQPLLQGKQNELILSELHGKYYTQSYRGNVYWASTAIGGVTITAVTNTTNTGLCIWNPQGSGKNVSLISVTIAPTTVAGTTSSFGYGFVANAGAAVGTGAAVVTFTQITATRGPAVINAVGQGNSVALVSGGSVVTPTPVFYRTMGGNVGTLATTSASQTPVLREDFDGTAIIPPGTLFIIGGTLAEGSTATPISALWEETPL